ncbi:hypothetical protein [Haloferula rosea]|uniref:hypothetical protein n=1 Tax=Haloferula rosea TaxID=490093 RepID=UPI001F1EC62F|nr:hypothetical protein [Haloferula rosea]
MILVPLATLVLWDPQVRMAPMVPPVLLVPMVPMVSMVSQEPQALMVHQVLLEQALRTEPKAPMVHRVRSAWDPMTSAMLVIRVRPVVLATKVPQALTDLTVLKAVLVPTVKPAKLEPPARTATSGLMAEMASLEARAESGMTVSLVLTVMTVLTVMQVLAVPLVSPVDPVVPTVSMVSAESVWSAWVTPR